MSAALTEDERAFLADERAIDARIDTQFKELPESGDIACNEYAGFSEPFRQLLTPFFGSNGPDFC